MRNTSLYRRVLWITVFAVLLILFTPQSTHYSDDYILITLLRYSFLINFYLLLHYPLPQIRMNNQHQISENKQLLLRSFKRPLSLCERNLPLISANLLAMFCCFRVQSLEIAYFFIIQIVLILAASLYIAILPLFMKYRYDTTPYTNSEIICITLHLITLIFIVGGLYANIFHVNQLAASLIYIVLYIISPVLIYTLIQYTIMQYADILDSTNPSIKKPSITSLLILFAVLLFSSIMYIFYNATNKLTVIYGIALTVYSIIAAFALYYSKNKA